MMSFYKYSGDKCDGPASTFPLRSSQRLERKEYKWRNKSAVKNKYCVLQW